MSARYAVGVGARSEFGAEDLSALVRETALRFDVALAGATLAALKSHENVAGFAQAAEQLGMRLALFSAEELPRAGLLTHSQRIERLYGVGSLAEALALAAAGEGASLLAPRVATLRLTCAVAKGGHR
ncbi:MAG TPA: cobalamin biosynthesis protein [Methylocystis sp.]|nr:cobalamin biosynthesis protein [Methylocystis sp.]